MRPDFCVAILVTVLLSLVRGAAAEDLAPAQDEAVISSFVTIEQIGTSTSTLTGQMAPDFTLPDDQMNAVRLGELRGKWVVLHFYAAGDIPDCSCKINDFTRQLQAFHDLDAVVLGVSTGSPEQFQNLRKKYDLKLAMLSDQDKQVIKQYGAWAETTLDGVPYGRVIRGTFVIDPDGRIRRHWPEVMPQGHVDRVRTFIESQIHLAQQPTTPRDIQERNRHSQMRAAALRQGAEVRRRDVTAVQPVAGTATGDNARTTLAPDAPRQ